MMQGGLTDFITNYELRNATWCVNPPKKSGSESRPFTIEDFLGVFIIYGFGKLSCLSWIYNWKEKHNELQREYVKIS